MNDDIRCPRCAQPAAQKPACNHLRWRPERGGPIDFAKSILREKPVPGMRASSIPVGWWESQHEWLLDRITTRIEVIDGYCFADSGEMDRLWLDLKHKLAPEPEREMARTEI